MVEESRSKQVDDFIQEQIETVPHLEALLLAWKTRPKEWSVGQMASSLYVPEDLAASILKDLTRRGLLHESEGHFRYAESDAQNDLLGRVDATYRRELIRITRMIHSKAPSGVREFARSFRFTKEDKK